MKSVTFVMHSFKSVDESLNMAQPTDLKQFHDCFSATLYQHFAGATCSSIPVRFIKKQEKD